MIYNKYLALGRWFILCEYVINFAGCKLQNYKRMHVYVRSNYCVVAVNGANR